MKTYTTIKMLAFTFAILCFIGGCSKSSTTNNNNPDGTWSFKGITYKEVFSGGSYSTIVFEDTAANPGNSLTLQFPGVAMPSTNSSFTISDVTQPSPGKVYISFNKMNTIYQAISGDGSHTVNVTVTNGKLTISGTNIPMVQQVLNPPDTSALVFNLHEI